MRPPPPKGDTLADWHGWWFGLECCKVAYMPIRMLVSGGWRPDRTLADIASKFRCIECNHRPASIWMTSDPASGMTEAMGTEIREEVPGLRRV